MLLLVREHFTGHNPFAVLGAIPEDVTRDDGSPRCAGSFRYASLLGTLGATFLPLYLGLSCNRSDRRLAWVGIVFCLGIIWMSNSGGPINATAIGMIGWLLWPIRTRMRLVRWGIVAWIAIAAMVMKAPVWYLIAKVADLTGGDGWHRSYLIDVSFRHLNQWWFAGMKDELTSDWFGYVVPVTGAADITNAYISYGLTAGLMATILFIVLLTWSFSQLGKALAAVRNSANETDHSEYILWGLGTMLAAHVANWFGVTYFDQTYVMWYLQLAAISTLSQVALNPLTSPVRSAIAVESEIQDAQPASGGACPV